MPRGLVHGAMRARITHAFEVALLLRPSAARALDTHGLLAHTQPNANIDWPALPTTMSTSVEMPAVDFLHFLGGNIMAPGQQKRAGGCARDQGELGNSDE